MKKITIELIGTKFEVRHPTIFEDAEWRSRLWGLISPILDEVTPGQVAASADGVDDKDAEVELNIGKIMQCLGGSGPSELIELMFLYSKDLSRNRLRIINAVNDGSLSEDDLLDAARRVFEFAAPTVKKTFDQAMSVAETLTKGFAAM